MAVARPSACDDDTMSDDTLVVWDESLLGYDMGEHPLDPVRVELTMALARELGVLDRPGVRLARPVPADDAQHHGCTFGLLDAAGPPARSALRRY